MTININMTDSPVLITQSVFEAFEDRDSASTNAAPTVLHLKAF
jgi:hypothetical protein